MGIYARIFIARTEGILKKGENNQKIGVYAKEKSVKENRVGCEYQIFCQVSDFFE